MAQEALTNPDDEQPSNEDQGFAPGTLCRGHEPTWQDINPDAHYGSATNSVAAPHDADAPELDAIGGGTL